MGPSSSEAGKTSVSLTLSITGRANQKSPSNRSGSDVLQRIGEGSFLPPVLGRRLLSLADGAYVDDVFFSESSLLVRSGFGLSKDYVAYSVSPTRAARAKNLQRKRTYWAPI